VTSTGLVSLEEPEPEVGLLPVEALSLGVPAQQKPSLFLLPNGTQEQLRAFWLLHVSLVLQLHAEQSLLASGAVIPLFLHLISRTNAKMGL
jgi:hypothetical protein